MADFIGEASSTELVKVACKSKKSKSVGLARKKGPVPLQTNESNLELLQGHLEKISVLSKLSAKLSNATVSSATKAPPLLTAFQSNTTSSFLQPSVKPTLVKKVGLSQPKQAKTGAGSPNTTLPPPPVPEYLRRRKPAGKPVKHFSGDENLKDKLVGVVITIFSGSSYDAMFREVKPTTVPGERVSTYSISCSDIDQLHEHLVAFAAIPTLASTHKLPRIAVDSLQGFLAEDEWRNLVQDVHCVPADSVVFNWECCSGCGDHGFPRCGDACKRVSQQGPGAKSQVGAGLTMKLMGFAVRSGWTVMCSDFSLKSLLSEWSEEELGPNPFLKVGSCNARFCLEFVPSELQNEDVPQQLQVVGELCADQGKAVVAAMSDTIVYTVKPDRPKTTVYDLKVLTVVTDMSQSKTGLPKTSMCGLGEGDAAREGWAGHVALTYAAGGQLVTSMGHWIELSRIDTSVESVMRVAEKNFGSTEAATFREELSKATSEVERSACIQERAYKMVTKSAPSRMKKRTKF